MKYVLVEVVISVAARKAAMQTFVYVQATQQCSRMLTCNSLRVAESS
jgi:hypothetical protein